MVKYDAFEASQQYRKWNFVLKISLLYINKHCWFIQICIEIILVGEIYDLERLNTVLIHIDTVCFEGLASLYTKKKGLNIECFNFSMIRHLPLPSAYAQSHLRKEILMVHVLHYKKPCFLGGFFVFFVLAFFCRNGKLRFENNSFSRLYLELAIFL